MSNVMAPVRRVNTEARRAHFSLAERMNLPGAHVCIQRDAHAPEVQTSAASLVRAVVNTPGQALDAATRSFMEPRFGYDFSDVRVHTDRGAADSARAVNAKAFTSGTHVAFDEGAYAPGSINGQRLIAHELTHVVQQSLGAVSGEVHEGDLSVSHPGDRHEQHARAVADRVAGNHDRSTTHERMPVATRQTGRVVQRQPYDDPNKSAQRSADYGEASAISGGIIGGLGLVGALAGLIISGKTLAATRRQADAAEDPPSPQLAQGGLTSTHVDKIDEIKGPGAAVDETESVDIQDVSSADDKKKGITKTQKTTTRPDAPTIVETETKKGKTVINSTKRTMKDAEKVEGEKDNSLTVLRLQEGQDNVADFRLTLRFNGRDIKGGNTEDGNIIGYTGGSVASNAGVAFKAGPAAPLDAPARAAVRIAFAGFNTPKRMTLGEKGSNDAPTKTANAPQRFNGSMKFDAKGELVPNSALLSVAPLGTSSKNAGDGKSAPVVIVSLNAPGASAKIQEPQVIKAEATPVPPPPKP